MKKLITTCFLFIVTLLSLIITISLLLVVTNPSYSSNDFSFTTILLGLLCGISIFYISCFVNIILLTKPKYTTVYQLNDAQEKNA